MIFVKLKEHLIKRSESNSEIMSISEEVGVTVLSSNASSSHSDMSLVNS